MNKIILSTLLIGALGLVTFYLGHRMATLEEETLVATQDATGKSATPRRRSLPLPVLVTAMPPAAQLDEVTRQVVGYDQSLSIKQRNKLVWSLRQRQLGASDFSALYAFLKTNPTAPGAQLAWHSLKNDLLVMTIDDGRYKEQTAQVMIDIITSLEQHPVMREYVLQYTTDYFERHWLDRRTMEEKSDFSAIDRQYQRALLTAMWTAVQDRDQSVAATALVRLHELSTRFSFVDRDKITTTTIRLIKDDTTPESSHMAALRVAAARRLSVVREEAENIVANASYSVAVRMAAMHTAVTMEPGEKFIDSLVSDFIKNKDADKRLKKAATLLLKKLSNRKA